MIDMRRILRVSAPPVLMIAIGCVAGYVAREYVLAPYQASSTIPLEDVQAFKAAEPLLRSSGVLERYAAAHGLQNDSAITGFARQLSTGQNKPVSITVSYPVTRTDIKDLPEAMSRDLLREAKVRPMISVTVAHADNREAIRRHAIIRDYVKDTLLRSALVDTLQSAFVDAQNSEARLTSQISENNLTALSLARQIKEMDDIRTRYDDLPSAKAGAPASDREIIQVPTSETRFLSPERQLVGLEAQKAHVGEQTRLAAVRLASAKATAANAIAFMHKLNESTDAAPLLQAELDTLSSSTENGSDADGRYAAQEARNKLRERLTVLQGTYVTLASAQTGPLVYRTGPGLTSAIGGGGVLGFLLWFVLLRFSMNAARRPDELTFEGPSPGSPIPALDQVGHPSITAMRLRKS